MERKKKKKMKLTNQSNVFVITIISHIVGQIKFKEKKQQKQTYYINLSKSQSNSHKFSNKQEQISATVT